MQHLQHRTLSFSEFTLDLTRGCLLRGDEEIKLRPKSFEALRHLVENNGRLISKNELIAAVWPDTSVTDDSLVQCLIEVRRALGEEGQQIVKTVPRRGYIFEAQVRQSDFAEREFVYTDEVESVSLTIEEETNGELAHDTKGVSAIRPIDSRALHRRTWLRSRTGLACVALMGSALAGLVFWQVWRKQPKGSPPVIKALAVLPLKSQIREGQDDYLGLGIANEIITKVSQAGVLTVRPTSAIRKYTNQEVDALAAARELQVDAVLDGTYLRVGDQLRITVNLLRVSDGASLWAETFDQHFTDIFAIQDRVSQQVAQRLWLKLSPAEQDGLTKRYTSDPKAYSYYVKAMYHFFNIRPGLNGRSESDLAVDLFKKAIELDPDYALAHAQLGYAYTRIAVFQEDNPRLIDQARKELGTAEKLDPQLAEVHVARYFIAFSQYEGWSVETAIRELRLAQQLDPSVGHPELVDLYAHIGLEKQSVREFNLALQMDPNSEELKNSYINSLFISGRPEVGLEARKKFFNHGPDLRYFLEKRMVKEAELLAKQEYEKDPTAIWKFVYQAVLLALQGKHGEAQAAVPLILEKERRYRGYHHDTYNIARIYALDGKSAEAIKWMRVTVAEGFQHYPRFERDSFLDRIRDDPAFKQFMAEMKTRWEGYQREFG
jgi:DNA-binding winged helix-turn-helix (wHTH) protein/TolB-like protein/Tfp pilus assembly protein PilF